MDHRQRYANGRSTKTERSEAIDRGRKVPTVGSSLESCAHRKALGGVERVVGQSRVVSQELIQLEPLDSL